MHPSDKEIGQNVQVARYRKGLSQEDLARAMNVDRSAISRIESGARAVSAVELSWLSSVLGVSASELLKPIGPENPPPVSRGMVFRAALIEPSDRIQLDWLAAVTESLSPSGTIVAIDPRLVSNPPRVAGELVASAVRKQLSISPREAIPSLSAVAYRAGVAALGARMPTKSKVSGASLSVGNQRSCILVNTNHGPTRQRFTAAHELGHVLMDGIGEVSTCEPESVRPGPKAAVELRADVFAASLLIPRRLVANLPREITAATVDQISRATGASYPAVVSRLRGLGRISTFEASVLRKAATAFREDGSRPGRLPAFRIAGASLLGRLGAARDLLDDCEVVPDEEVVK